MVARQGYTYELYVPVYRSFRASKQVYLTARYARTLNR